MATMGPGPTTTATITPPRSSHGIRDSWGYSEPQKEGLELDIHNTANHYEDTHKSHFATQNGNPTMAPYHSGIELASRKMNSTDNLGGGRQRPSGDGGPTSPYGELKPSPTFEDGSWGSHNHHQNGDDRKRSSAAISEKKSDEENSKWIHRDKLARIESEELQAAGIFIPRARATSKQRRERSRSAMRRGTDASEHNHTNRSRKNSTAVESRTSESRAEAVNSWDLRTPEEIAEEEANAYFTSIPSMSKIGSRIPVAKVSPAPLLLDPAERAAAAAAQRAADGLEEDQPLTYQKTRSRSASMKGSDATSLNGSALPTARRSVTDVSPKKSAVGARKTSGPNRTGPTGRPKTRSSSNKESNGSISTRPSTRSGELSPGNKAPEGDPPWLINAYKPDPRLPPDQQLLPTVARRLQQEKWEKEGKFGDVYDKEFRPLNDHVPLKPLDLEKNEPTEENQPGDEWPLRGEPVKSPRQGSSYSTMPKISDKQQHTPLASPRTPVTPNAPPQMEEPPKPAPKPTPERAPEPVEDKGGCGCCIVM